MTVMATRATTAATAADAFTQGRIRVNREGALLLQRLLSQEIDEILRRRKEAIRAGFDDEVPGLNQEVGRARRVYEELERVFHERWPGSWPD